MLITVISVLTILAAFPGSIMASGFAITEQSVSGLGNAFSGSAAASEDASTVFHNPAGMTLLKGQQIIIGLHIISPRTEFKDEGSRAVSGIAVPGIPPVPSFNNVLAGGSGGDAGGIFTVPNFYYVLPLAGGWSFGLGLNSPFGLSTEYDPGWVGRYYGVKSELNTVNINPAFALRLSDEFSLGFGVSIQYLDAELSNAVDYGTLDTLGYFDKNLSDGKMDPVFGLRPQRDDGFTAVKGDSWGYGFNLGVLYEFSSGSRIGMSYRSRVSHDVEGDVDWTLPGTNGFDRVMAAATPQGLFQDGGVSSDIDLPASASLSYYHNVNYHLSVMADITWTEWGVLEELVLDYA
ncbi:MAG: outer membrane protein transport protein, partial [Nitrospirota bacterium]